jgi:dihydrolipoamide dehydrogenase
MSSTELMATDRLPRRLCIVGAGVIGMEMASVFSRFGAEVTVVEFLRECLPAVDDEIAKRLRKQMERQGIAFVMQAAVQEVALMPTGERRVAYLDKKGRECLLQADAVLVATGRQPNTLGLKLETTGVAIGRGGFIVVDDNMQTTVPHLYAIGDVNGRNLLAHAATMQGFRAVRHILRSMDDGRCLAVDGECPVPAAIFTVPECACVGMTEEQAKEQLPGYVCRKSHYRSSGRAVAMEQTEGMVKLLADGTTGRIVGCHVYGAHAADIVQEATALMSLGATVDQLASVVHIHPTLGELLQEAAL